MIKIGIRRNLRYPLLLLIWSTVRDIENILIKYFFNFKNLEIYSQLMFLGEFIAGLIFFIYNKKFLANIERRKSLALNLGINVERNKPEKDSQLKIIFLLFYSAFLDLVQFSLFLHYDKYLNISISFEQRLRGLFIIDLALYYYYVLKFPMLRHQIFSLIVIGSCIIIIVIIELCFLEFDIFLSFGQFIITFINIIFILFISSLGQIIEKYLIEIDQLSPFYILMMQGIFGIILSTIANIASNSSENIEQIRKKISNSKFAILIVSFILYVILSGGKNLYRLETLRIYSPMTSTFMEYILNPLYNIYYFASGNDFLHNGKSNWAFFIMNFIISLFVTFFGFVYNEFLIVFCCGLECDTHDQVILRAANDEKELKNLYAIKKIEEEEEEEEEIDEDDNNNNVNKRENFGLFKYTKMDLK